MKTLSSKHKLIEQIKQSIKQTNLSQKELASKCNLKECALCRYLSGTRKMDIEKIVNICNYLKISLDETLELNPEYSKEYLNKILK